MIGWHASRLYRRVGWVLPAAVAAVLAVSAWTLTERGVGTSAAGSRQAALSRRPGNDPWESARVGNLPPRSVSVSVRLLKEREPPSGSGAARVPSVPRAPGSRSLNVAALHGSLERFSAQPSRSRPKTRGSARAFGSGRSLNRLGCRP